MKKSSSAMLHSGSSESRIKRRLNRLEHEVSKLDVLKEHHRRGDEGDEMLKSDELAPAQRPSGVEQLYQPMNLVKSPLTSQFSTGINQAILVLLKLYSPELGVIPFVLLHIKAQMPYNTIRLDLRQFSDEFSKVVSVVIPHCTVINNPELCVSYKLNDSALTGFLKIHKLCVFKKLPWIESITRITCIPEYRLTNVYRDVHYYGCSWGCYYMYQKHVSE